MAPNTIRQQLREVDVQIRVLQEIRKRRHDEIERLRNEQKDSTTRLDALVAERERLKGELTTAAA